MYLFYFLNRQNGVLPLDVSMLWSSSSAVEAMMSVASVPLAFVGM